MDVKTRTKYVEQIASAIRYAAKETMISWPEDAIIVAKSYTGLAETDEIIGMKVYVMDMPSSYDFFVAFPSENEVAYRLQKAFLEYIELYDIS